MPSRPRLGQRQVVRTGPYKSVRSVDAPYAGPPDVLIDAVNLVFPDSAGMVSAFARPAFNLMNDGDPVFTSAVPFKCQAIYSHPMLDGTRLNFVVMGGHLFRLDGAVFTDVTPVDVTIDPAVTTVVSGLSLIGQAMFTDGVNRPWKATNLTSTPITGTYIDYDGTGVAWNTIGQPTLFGNAPFVMLDQVGGVSRRTDIAWGEPGFLDTGWQQPTYDNNWTLETASAGVLYAIEGTNAAFFYWRALSIGTAVGTVGPDLASSATEDTIGFNVGTQAARTLQQFGNSFFFCDSLGRPWRFVPGSAPEPIWTQMQRFVSENSTGAPSVTGLVAVSAVETTHNKYLVGIWSPTPTTQESVTELYSFDANTGRFEGRWVIGPGISIDCLGSFVDTAGRVTIVASGSKLAAPAQNGYLWALDTSSTTPLTRVTQSGAVRLTMAGRTRVTQYQSQTFTDNGELTRVSATIPPILYDDQTLVLVDRATVITGTQSPISVTVLSSMMVETVEGTPTPSLSHDGTFRLVCGCECTGRGPTITVIPLDTTEQWSLHSVSATVVPTQAGPEDA